MSTIGIVCEYNPFHKGHEYQIEQAKAVTNADHVVCFMSGDFLQRGVPALADKYTRAEIALRCGVDVVFEIPFVYATSSARDYAFAAVTMMNLLQDIDYIAFGAETEDLQLLSDIADITVNEPSDVSDEIQRLSASGISYGLARASAVSAYLSKNTVDRDSRKYRGYTEKNISTVMSSPNNILAIEYLAAMSATNSKLKPILIKRISSAYDSLSAEYDICSASAIRELLRNGNLSSLERHVPEPCYHMLKERYQHVFPIFEDSLSYLLNASRLFLHARGDISDMDVDLANRLNKLDINLTFTETSAMLKCRNYTLTHIQRGLLHTITQLHVSDMDHFKQDGWITYINILGLKKESSNILGSMKRKCEVPLITKNSEMNRQSSPAAQAMFRYDVKAYDIYRNIIYQTYKTNIPSYYKRSIILI